MLIIIEFNNMEESEGSDTNSGWISWFCELEGHEFFAEVFLFFIEN